jgi:hypothetical protein
MGVKAVLKALSALTNGELQSEDFAELERQANAEKNHRGGAILIATNLENALEHAIERRLETGPERRKELFGINAPISRFANKIIIAQALKIIGPETRQNLDIIRGIRNAFAHAKNQSCLKPLP